MKLLPAMADKNGVSKANPHHTDYLKSEWIFAGAKQWLAEHGFGKWTSLEIILSSIILVFVMVFLVRRLVWRGRGKAYRWLRRRATWNGYVRLETPSGDGEYEHRKIAESILGRRLQPGEVVHHINGRRADNRPANLCVMESIEHDRYHKWYDWVFKTYGRYPRRATQLRKLTREFRGTLLADPSQFKKRWKRVP